MKSLEPLIHHRSDGLTLQQVLDHLARCERVLGVLRIGSQGTPGPGTSSDLDLVLVLAGLAGADALAHRVGLTWVGGQLTDLLYVSEGELDRLLTAEGAIDGASWLGRIARWFAAGTVLLDRDGRLGRLCAAMSEDGRITRPEPAQQHDRVWSICYNLAQNERMARSNDPLYRQALAMRLLYCVSDLMTAYFALRGLHWEGEKAALRHWQARDTRFAEAMVAYLDADSLETRIALYRLLVDLTLAPVGGAWGQDHRVPPQPLPEFGADDIWEYCLSQG